MRRSVLGAATALVLSACASAPQGEAPKPVTVKAGEVSREYSSFDTSVRSETASIKHSFVASLDPSAEPFMRLESAYTQELSDGEQLRIGDTVSAASMWGSAVRYGGMQFGTRSTAREDVVYSSELATSGVASLPTAADALFASANSSSDPGNFSYARSWQSGAMTVRDSFGRSASVDAPIIASTRLAQAGCSDFAVGGGKARQDYAIESNEYGPAFANATVACAAPLGFTVEGHGEYLEDDVAAVGLGVARRVGSLGVASFAYASSHAEAGEEGWLARVGFEHSNDRFNVAWRKRLQSREFRQAGGLTLVDPVMQRDLASVGVNVARKATLSLAYATQTTWSQERTNVIAVQQSLSVGRGSLSMSAGHSLEDNFGSSLFLTYKRPLGGGSRRERSKVEEFEPVLLESLGSY